MIVRCVLGAVRTREAGLWAFVVATTFTFSGVLAGCGGPDQTTGTEVKPDPVTQQQVKSMEDFYKKNPLPKTKK